MNHLKSKEIGFAKETPPQWTPCSNVFSPNLSSILKETRATTGKAGVGRGRFFTHWVKMWLLLTRKSFTDTTVNTTEHKTPTWTQHMKRLTKNDSLYPVFHVALAFTHLVCARCGGAQLSSQHSLLGRPEFKASLDSIARPYRFLPHPTPPKKSHV